MKKNNKNYIKYLLIGVLLFIAIFAFFKIQSTLGDSSSAFVTEYPPISVLDLRMRAKAGYVYITLLGVPKNDLSQLKHESFKSIRSIEFGDMNIDVDVINYLSHLQVNEITIGYHNTAFNDDVIKLFKKFPKLEKLYIRNCNLTSEGIQNMSKLENLKTLKLVAPVKDDSLNAISNIENLNSLSINVPMYPSDVDKANSQCFPKLTGRHLKELCKLNSLEELDLSGLPIDDTTFPELVCLSQLKKLFLGKTFITDASLRNMVHFPHLTQLGMNNTRTGRFNFNYLTQLKNLKLLSMHNTMLDDSNFEYLIRNSQLSTEDILENGTMVTREMIKKLSHINRKSNNTPSHQSSSQQSSNIQIQLR